ncbi:MAG: VIT domain-containing protein [Saprospiraceae bacterium]
MKKIYLLGLLLCSIQLLQANTPLVFGTPQPTVAPVNAIIGDLSYLDKFGKLPTRNTNDQLRIKTHLAFVESTLRCQNVDHLPQALQQQRTMMLDQLRGYWQTGIFPKNDYFLGERKPIFIDRQDRVCAVGYLVQQTSGQALCESINQDFQFSYLWEMEHTGLAEWVANSGLTAEECAMIQPSYILPEPTPRSPRLNPGMFAMELRSNQVQTEITGQSATTSMDQVFYNPSNRAMQGEYIFPIPKGASVDQFSMYINGVETKGEVLDAKKARKIYEGIVRRFQDPALLEYYNNGLFRVRIFPIPPRSEQRVKLTYTQSLPKENGTIAYTFPFKHKSSLAKAIGQASFKIKINAQEKIKNVYCPTHEVEINRKGDQTAVVGYEGKNVSSEQDFKLYYSTAKSKVGVSLLSFNDQQEDGYFFLNVSPGFAAKEKVVAKDISFIVDASGSMAGKKMEQAKKALNFCINNLNEEDRFNIIRFSTEASTLFPNLQKVTKQHCDQATRYIEKLKPIGGTNIDEALAMALAHQAEKNRPHFVVFLTDGKPTIGETNTDNLLKKVKHENTNQTRIFTFGIGTELNTHLLDKLTDMTEAYRTYVLPNEDIEVKLSDFYTKVSSPILTNIDIKFSGDISTTEVYPKHYQDLFKGSTLTLLGRYSGDGKGKITISGEVNGKKETLDYDVFFEKKSENFDFIPSLWATRSVGFLLDQIRLNGQNKELIESLVKIAKQHGIITPYTSYLIIEDEGQLLSANRIRQEDALLSNRVRTQSQAQPLEDMEMVYEESIKKESGKASVEASAEVQAMNDSRTISSTRTTNSKLAYKDQNGQLQNLASGISNVQGRAVYNQNNQWVDANLQLDKNRNLKNVKIQFNSDAYFKLMEEEPQSIAFLSLGKNVRFVMNETIWEIHE